MKPPAPLPGSYWVVPGRLLAGEYPYAPDPARGREKVRALVAAGVDFVIDLTEKGEHGLLPYARALEEEARTAGRAVTRVRLPIPDFGVPADPRGVLDALEKALDDGRTVYIHCFGGIGRTGTLVGLYLVERGLTGDEALGEIARLRAMLKPHHSRLGVLRSPESDEQRELVRTWRGRTRR
jgi:hypothetical protein